MPQVKFTKKGTYTTLREYIETITFTGARDQFLSSFYTLLDDMSPTHRKAVEAVITSLISTRDKFKGNISTISSLIQKNVKSEMKSTYLLKEAEKISKNNENDSATDYRIDGLKEAAAYLRFAAKNKIPIYLYADYDTDGIGVSYIGVKIMERLHVNPSLFTLFVPRRFSDGYGLTVDAVKSMAPYSLLITGDNGIAALEPIRLAKEKNIKVVILDHHHASTILPPADVIVDPEAFPYKADFTGYCGAGLLYRLYKELFSDDIDPVITSMAAVSTIADSVPLLSENREIVRNGVQILNAGSGIPAFSWLLQNFNYYGHVRAEDLSFSMIPCLNAPGRLDDNGARNVVNTLLLQTSHPSFANNLHYMIEQNDGRKKLTSALMEQITLDQDAKINFVIAPPGYPGLYGLIASKITTDTGKPSFVMGDRGNGILSGSARSDNEKTNSVKNMLMSVRSYLTSFGGHDGAAGFALKKENFDTVKALLNELPVTPHKDELFYDLEITPDQIENTLYELEKHEPFGKGFRRPVFRMDVHLTEDQISFIGKDSSTLKFTFQNWSAILFHGGPQYKEDGCPKNLSLYGALNWNYFKGSKTPSFQISGYNII